MSKRSVTRKLDELQSGPCGTLAGILAAKGHTSSLVTRPRSGLLAGYAAVNVLLSLIPEPHGPLAGIVAGNIVTWLEPGVLFGPAAADSLLALIQDSGQET
jgi:hypothetical protein